MVYYTYKKTPRETLCLVRPVLTNTTYITVIYIFKNLVQGKLTSLRHMYTCTVTAQKKETKKKKKTTSFIHLSQLEIDKHSSLCDLLIITFIIRIMIIVIIIIKTSAFDLISVLMVTHAHINSRHLHPRH